MKALLILLSILGSHQEQSPRLRTKLLNGAIILAERMAGERAVSVQLWIGGAWREGPETHGARHLLEHLLARGPKNNHDARLESAGMFLVARTFRDALQFEVICRPGQIDIALDALASVLRPIETKQEEIAKEAGVIAEEIALQSDAAKLGMAAWRAAYGAHGGDPLGTPDVLKGLSPTSLTGIQKDLFVGHKVVLTIAGDIDLSAATARSKKMLETVPSAAAPQSPGRPAGAAGRSEATGASGEARAALVPSYKDPRTMASLAGALAVASQFDSSFVTYTPTTQNGLVIVGRTDENSGVGLKIDALQPHEEGALFPIGKLLARQWVERYLGSPSGTAFLRGLLLVQGESNRPETMLEIIERMTIDDFIGGLKRLKKEQAVVVVGVKG